MRALEYPGMADIQLVESLHHRTGVIPIRPTEKRNQGGFVTSLGLCGLT